MQLQGNFLVLLTVTTAAFAAVPVNQLVGFGAGTTGGGSASATTVTSCSALKTAAGSSSAAVIKINGLLSGCGVIDIKSNKSIWGVGTSSGLTGGGFRIKSASNVILRNLQLGPPTSGGDVISLDKATKVWIDHNDIRSTGLVGDKDDFDGLLDITHASSDVTVSWNKFHDHWKGSLIGHSDSNESEDTGKLKVTYHHNSFINVNSRLPSLRFGTGHIYNSFFSGIPTSGINSRMGAQVLVENSVFNNVKLAIVTDLDSDESGFATQRGNIFTGSDTRITGASSFSPSYAYTMDPAADVQAIISASGGTGKVSPP